MSAADTARYAPVVKKRLTRVPVWAGPYFFVLAVLNLAVWSSRPRHDLTDTAGEVFYLVVSAWFVVTSFVSWRTFRIPIEALDGATLLLNDQGIASERLPAPLPWQRIIRAVDVGGAIAIFPFRRPAIVIPKASVADGGAALWSFLEQHMIGKRMLRRSPSTTILNTRPDLRAAAF